MRAWRGWFSACACGRDASAVNSVQLTVDKSLVVSGDDAGKVRVWDVQSTVLAHANEDDGGIDFARESRAASQLRASMRDRDSMVTHEGDSFKTDTPAGSFKSMTSGKAGGGAGCCVVS